MIGASANSQPGYAPLAVNGQITIDDYADGQAVPPGAVVLNVASNIYSAPNGGKLIVMGAETSAVADFPQDPTITGIVLGTGDGNNVNFQTNNDVAAQLMGGHNDTVITGNGNDVLATHGGSFSIDVGGGNDLIRIGSSLAGEDYIGDIASESGALTMIAYSRVSEERHIKFDCGDGFDHLEYHGNFLTGLNSGYTTGTASFYINMPTDVISGKGPGVTGNYSPANPEFAGTGLEVVDSIDMTNGAHKITVLADAPGDSLTAKLHKVALGRQPLDSGDSLEGIKFWTTQFDQGTGFDGIQHSLQLPGLCGIPQ